MRSKITRQFLTNKSTLQHRQKSPNCNFFYFLLNKTTQDINTSTILRKESDESTHFPSSLLCGHFFIVVVVGSQFLVLYLRHADDIVCCKYEKAEICIRIFYYFSLPTTYCPSQVNTWHCLITLMCCSCCFGQFIEIISIDEQKMLEILSYSRL